MSKCFKLLVCVAVQSCKDNEIYLDFLCGKESFCVATELIFFIGA